MDKEEFDKGKRYVTLQGGKSRQPDSFIGELKIMANSEE